MRIEYSIVTATAGTNNTTLGTLAPGSWPGTTLSFTVQNAGPGALTDFLVQVRPHSTAPWVTVASGVGFTNTAGAAVAGGDILSVYTTPTTLAANGTSLVNLRINAAQDVKFLAKTSDANGAVVTVRAGGVNA